MRFARTTYLSLLAVLAIGAPLSAPLTSALAATSAGGVAAPSGVAPATRAVHTSAIATWFGPGFYGHKTACGQTLTPGVIGVANRTLPCGTLVRVTYAGRTLTVPVLDRGPYSHIADWDLTSGAAAALGIGDTVRIRARVVGTAPNTPTLGLPSLPATSALTGGASAG